MIPSFQGYGVAIKESFDYPVDHNELCKLQNKKWIGQILRRPVTEIVLVDFVTYNRN